VAVGASERCEAKLQAVGTHGQAAPAALSSS
jgi:hypothetical protein